MLIAFLNVHLFTLIPQPKGIENLSLNLYQSNQSPCIVLMLPFGFNFLLEDTEVCSKEGLKLQLTNLSLYINI